MSGPDASKRKILDAFARVGATSNVDLSMLKLVFMSLDPEIFEDISFDALLQQFCGKPSAVVDISTFVEWLYAAAPANHELQSSHRQLPQLLDTSKAAGERHRKLEDLAKAHLHLHLPAAMRRSSFESAVQKYLAPGSSLYDKILADLDKREERDLADGNAEGVAQTHRRRAWLEGGCLYPASLDSTDLACFDLQMPQKALVWDIQFVAKYLLESKPQDGIVDDFVQQTVLELARDASSEGILHIELMTGFTPWKPNDAQGGKEASDKWTALFKSRAEALSGVPDLSLMYVMVMPSSCKTQADAEEVVRLLHGTAGYDSTAMAGVGYFAGEHKIKDYAGAFAAFRQAGYRLVCIHAGEGEPSRGKGPTYIRHALEMGAERIGHGIEAAAESELMAELCEMRVCLEVCPLSNRALECCPYFGSSVPSVDATSEGLSQHPLIRLLAAGVECSLSADDPLYWAGENDGAHGLVREFRTCRELMGLDDAALAKLADASLVHSSAPAEVVDRGRRLINKWLTT